MGAIFLKVTTRALVLERQQQNDDGQSSQPERISAMLR